MCPQNRNKSNRKLGRTWCPKTTNLWCNFLITTTVSYVWVWISVGIKYRVVILTYLELSDCTMCDIEVWIKNKVILQKYTVQCYRTTATYKSSLSITSNKFWNRSTSFLRNMFLCFGCCGENLFSRSCQKKTCVITRRWLLLLHHHQQTDPKWGANNLCANAPQNS